MPLTAENISLHISGFNLLRDVSMHVEAGTGYGHSGTQWRRKI